jgi:hypothetical protein
VDQAVFTGTGPSWTTDAISTHNLQSTLALSLPSTTDSLTVGVTLPPLTTALTGRMDLAAGFLKSSLQGGFLVPEAGMQYQPLIASLTADSGTGYSASEEVQLDIDTASLTKSTTKLTLDDVTATFIAQETAGVLVPSLFKIGYEMGGTPLWLWKDRINLTTTVKTHWSYNLQTYSDNLFDFNLNLTLSIYKFLDLTFASRSTNTKTYRYIPSWAEANGEAWVNPLVDLFESFDFADQANRIRSPFKINNLSIKAVQHFDDWDLSLQYAGAPELRTDLADNKTKYMWTPSFTISVQWKVASEVKSTITGDYSGVTLR